MSIKNFNCTIGNRTRDLGACSAVPQPSAPPRASPNISRYAKLRSWKTHVAYMRRLETETYCLSGILKKRDPSGHSYNWSIILKCVLKRQDGRTRNGFLRLSREAAVVNKVNFGPRNSRETWLRLY